jgi:hypothetical protein
MVTSYDIPYYVIYLLCLVLSLKARQRNIPGLFFLQLMLTSGLITEIIVEFYQYLNLNSNRPYYVYIPLEYCCLVLFYTRNTNNKMFKTIMVFSIFGFILMAFILSLFHYHFETYPSLIYNASCFLNTIWVGLLLYSLTPDQSAKLLKHPIFILYAGLIIFFAGIFFFNASYNYFLAKDKNIAEYLRNNTNIILNYILYLSMSYGFICSIRIKK